MKTNVESIDLSKKLKLNETIQKKTIRFDLQTFQEKAKFIASICC